MKDLRYKIKDKRWRWKKREREQKSRRAEEQKSEELARLKPLRAKRS